MFKRDIRSEKLNYIFLFFVLFGLVFVRYCYYGFNYYYQMDDYIQYHNYAAYIGSFPKLVRDMGLLSSRPLAGVADFFVWTRLYDKMIAAVAVISLMYAVSAIVLFKIFSKHFGTGYLFLLIYALMPLGFEGTYWVSASSRIVVGLFFASLSFYCFDVWCDEGRKRDLILFAALQLIAFCFYEQIILFSGALTFIGMLLNARGYGSGRARWGFLMFANAAVYFAFTKLMPAGVYGDREELFLPWQDGYFEHCFLSTGWQVVQVFLKGSSATLGKGLVRGFKLLISEPNMLYVLIVLVLCALLYVFVRSTRRDSIRFFAELFSGLFLAAAPLILFFVLKAPWFGFRNAVISFCGLGLALDAMFDLVFGRIKSGKTVEAVLVAALALVCCVASVSELHDYRETTLADTQLAEAAAEAFEGVSFSKNESIWLLNVNASYVSDGNFYFHEHDYGATASPWALTGVIRAVSGRGEIPLVSPISVYAAFAADESEITEAATYCYLDGAVIPATITKSADNLWSVAGRNGSVLGTMSYVKGGLWLKMG